MEQGPGKVIANRYRILSRLGQGGMGSVYLAEDTKLGNQQVAIKFLSTLHGKERREVERFHQEIYLARKLTHENIVGVYECGETRDGRHFIVMEYVQGQPLAALLNDGPVPFVKTLTILYGVAKAMVVAHAAGIVHRDIKPANVLLSDKQVVKLADFGLAKSLLEDKELTKSQHLVGTAYYMAPEQWTTGHVDARSDIYAFGLLAFELAAGKKPHDCQKPEQLMFKHLSTPLPKLERLDETIPGWFETFVMQCTEKHPELRYQNAVELVRLLTTELRQLGIDVADDEQLKGSSPQGEPNNRKRQIVLLARRNWMKMRIVYRHAIVAAVPAILYLALSIPAVGVVKSINFWTFDTWFRVRGVSKPPDNVVVVGIDLESHDQLGVSVLEPWPRHLHAQLLKRLATIQPKGVLFDFVFREDMDERVDAGLAKAMSDVPTYLARGVRPHFDKHGSARGAHSTVRTELNGRFDKTAAGVFSIEIQADHGIVRRFPVVWSREFGYPPLAPVALGERSFGREQAPNPGDFIHFYGPARTMNGVSYANLLRASLEELEAYRNAWLVVGFMRALPTNSEVADMHQTPCETKMAGVEILATMLGNILEQRWIRDYSAYVEGFGGAWFLFLVGFMVRQLRYRVALWTLLLTVAILPLLQLVSLNVGYYVPLAGLALLATGNLLVEFYLRTNHARRIFAFAKGC